MKDDRYIAELQRAFVRGTIGEPPALRRTPIVHDSAFALAYAFHVLKRKGE